MKRDFPLFCFGAVTGVVLFAALAPATSPKAAPTQLASISLPLQSTKLKIIQLGELPKPNAQLPIPHQRDSDPESSELRAPSFILPMLPPKIWRGK